MFLTTSLAYTFTASAFIMENEDRHASFFKRQVCFSKVGFFIHTRQEFHYQRFEFGTCFQEKLDAVLSLDK